MASPSTQTFLFVSRWNTFLGIVHRLRAWSGWDRTPLCPARLFCAWAKQAWCCVLLPSFIKSYCPHQLDYWIYVVYDHFYSSQRKVLWLLVGFFGIFPHLSSMKPGYTSQVSLWSATCQENTFKKGLMYMCIERRRSYWCIKFNWMVLGIVFQMSRSQTSASIVEIVLEKWWHLGNLFFQPKYLQMNSEADKLLTFWTWSVW